MAHALVPVALLFALFAPAVQGSMTNRRPEGAQAELQGAASALGIVPFPIGRRRG